MVTQAVQIMKKKPTTDGRRSRYEPISADEFHEAAKALESLAGGCVAAAAEIKDLKLAGVQIDGRNMLADSIEELRRVVKRVKTALYEVRLDREAE